jgi:hypothetical protein
MYCAGQTAPCCEAGSPKAFLKNIQNDFRIKTESARRQRKLEEAYAHSPSKIAPETSSIIPENQWFTDRTVACDPIKLSLLNAGSSSKRGL